MANLILVSCRQERHQKPRISQRAESFNRKISTPDPNHHLVARLTPLQQRICVLALAAGRTNAARTRAVDNPGNVGVRRKNSLSIQVNNSRNTTFEVMFMFSYTVLEHECKCIFFPAARGLSKLYLTTSRVHARNQACSIPPIDENLPRLESWRLIPNARPTLHRKSRCHAFVWNFFPWNVNVRAQALCLRAYAYLCRQCSQWGTSEPHYFENHSWQSTT